MTLNHVLQSCSLPSDWVPNRALAFSGQRPVGRQMAIGNWQGGREGGRCTVQSASALTRGQGGRGAGEQE